jgi:hypothetical protein
MLDDSGLIAPSILTEFDVNNLHKTFDCHSSAAFPSRINCAMASGKGVPNLKEWTGAVRATGYRGWRAAEIVSRNV